MSGSLPGDGAGGERAVQRGNALIDVAGELLDALIAGYGQPESPASRRAGHAAGAIDRRAEAGKRLK